MRPIMNLEELQEKVGLLENDQGIVYLSLFDTDLYELLQPYIETVDYRLYFDFANRIVIGKYEKAISTSKLSIVKKAIYYALKGEEYNLKTLINTTNLDYNPLENYELHETVVSTASISAFMKYGEINESSNINKSPYNIVTTTSYSADIMNIEKSMPERQETLLTTHSKQDETVTNNSENNIGAQENTQNEKMVYAELQKTSSETSTIGERIRNNDNEHKVSAYNAADYQSSFTDTALITDETATDTKSSTETTPSRVDVKDTTDNLGTRTDIKSETSETSKAEHFVNEVKTIAEITDTDTHSRSPHETSETQNIGTQISDTLNKTLEHENKHKQDSNDNKQRDLHGRYGFNTAQTMIESERRLANLNIADKMIDIIIHTICEGVLMLW